MKILEAIEAVVDAILSVFAFIAVAISGIFMFALAMILSALPLVLAFWIIVIMIETCS